MLSQHSRSQALVKEESCGRHGEPTLNLAILMEMKPERFSCVEFAVIQEGIKFRTMIYVID